MTRPTIHTEAEVRAAVEGARSYTEALRRMGLRAAGGNFGTLRRLVADYGISTDHMDPSWSTRGTSPPRERKPLTEVMVEGSTYKRSDLKRRLYEEGIKTRHCELCGQSETWQGRQMSLILDHVNGVHDDNRLKNLRIVCANCNATLDTHCGRQNRSAPRECLHCGSVFKPGYSSQQYCSRRCGSHSPGRTGPKPEARKVERPSYEQLRRELAESNYSAVARRYGVSDNAVRKWMRAYEYQRRDAHPS